jgi:hypothetical protein
MAKKSNGNQRKISIISTTVFVVVLFAMAIYSQLGNDFTSLAVLNWKSPEIASQDQTSTVIAGSTILAYSELLGNPVGSSKPIIESTSQNPKIQDNFNLRSLLISLFSITLICSYGYIVVSGYGYGYNDLYGYLYSIISYCILIAFDVLLTFNRAFLDGIIVAVKGMKKMIIFVALLPYDIINSSFKLILSIIAHSSTIPLGVEVVFRKGSGLVRAVSATLKFIGKWAVNIPHDVHSSIVNIIKKMHRMEIQTKEEFTEIKEEIVKEEVKIKDEVASESERLLKLMMKIESEISLSLDTKIKLQPARPQFMPLSMQTQILNDTEALNENNPNLNINKKRKEAYANIAKLSAHALNIENELNHNLENTIRLQSTRPVLINNKPKSAPDEKPQNPSWFSQRFSFLKK